MIAQENNVENVISYCQQNKRLCPLPMHWNDLWKMLANKKQIGGGWEPSAPLILAAWWVTSGLDKQIRLAEHIQWAEHQGQLDTISEYLHNLKEDDWYHLGD